MSYSLVHNNYIFFPIKLYNKAITEEEKEAYKTNEQDTKSMQTN